MGKKYIGINVYDAAQERIKYLFKEFDNVLVAFSGGKDSSVCLNMVYDYAKATGQLNKVAMYHLDYEAQYQMTTDFVTETFAGFDGIKKFWLCLPIAAQCCCNMDGGTWIVWDDSKKDIWVRTMPEYDYVINQTNCPFKMRKGETDYEIQNRFGKWFANTYGKTAIVIGIRATESLQRYAAVADSQKKIIYKDKHWCSIVDKITVDAYPIYDWTTQDIWVYNAKFLKSYNRLYDLYYQAGLNIDQMRVASPFNDCAANTLYLYKVIDPNNWARMVGRVNGVNFTSLYGGTTAMGWKSIKLPAGHTWKSYFYFLLKTLPKKTADHYYKIFLKSVKYWTVDGGNIEKDIYDDMMANNDLEIVSVSQAKKYQSKNKVLFKEYPDDVDTKGFKDVPSYKRMCVCILKNDYYCKYAGFGPTKDAIERRKKIMEKYKNL